MCPSGCSPSSGNSSLDLLYAAVTLGWHEWALLATLRLSCSLCRPVFDLDSHSVSLDNKNHPLASVHRYLHVDTYADGHVMVPFVSLDGLAALSETAPFSDAFTGKDVDHRTLSTDIFSTVARSDKRDLFIWKSLD
jgi:hypothetical protein